MIYNVDAGEFELYDLRTDPKEQQDLARNGLSIMEAMKGYLLDRMAHTARTARELPRAVPPAEFEAAEW